MGLLLDIFWRWKKEYENILVWLRMETCTLNLLLKSNSLTPFELPILLDVISIHSPWCLQNSKCIGVFLSFLSLKISSSFSVQGLGPCYFLLWNPLPSDLCMAYLFSSATEFRCYLHKEVFSDHIIPRHSLPFSWFVSST